MKVLLKLENEQTKADREKTEVVFFLYVFTKRKKAIIYNIWMLQLCSNHYRLIEFTFKKWMWFLNQLPCKEQK